MLITPQKLTEWGACADGKAWAVSVIGDGMELSKLLPKFRRADWMIWTLGRAANLSKVQYVELAVICAKTVLSIYEKKYPKDNRPRKAIKAAVEYTKSPTEENRIAATSATSAAYAAYAAAYAVAADAAYASSAYARKKHHAKMCKLILAKLKVWRIA